METTSDNLFRYLADLLAAGADPSEREAEIWARYGQTVAVLVLDSSGFSRVSESHGIVHFLTRLMLMRETISPVFEEFDCRHLHFEADNVIAVFDDPNRAIRGAIRIHETLFSEGVMLTETERFQVCIGVGYGRMLYSETLEGYFAEEMNFASKLGEDTANGGETLLTLNAFDAADQQLVAAFTERSTEVSGVQLSYFAHTFQPLR